MNKTININIGGYPFIINDDAYDLLSRYLDSIHRHFKSSGSYDEITGDIETRLAEIFLQKLGSRQIIELRDVQAAIDVMGKPEDFGAEPIDNQSQQSSQSRSEYRTGKRLFRDPEDKVFGGVCSGIAAYFGIADPLWVRIFFALLVFVFGVSAIFYFILWVAIPEALSSADRLAMRGEPINVSNIAKVVEEEFNNLSDAINNAGKGQDSAEKKNSSFSSSQYQRGKASQGIADAFSFLGEMVRRIIDAFKMIFKPIFGVVGGLLIFALGLGWVAIMIAFSYGHPLFNTFFGSSKTLGYIAGINVFFLIAAVIGILIMLFLNIFFKVKVQPKWYGFMGAFWILNGLSFGFAASSIAKEFSQDAVIREDIFNVTLPSDTIRLEVIRDKKAKSKFMFGDFRINEDNVTYNGVHLRIKRSPNNDFRLEKEVMSQGHSIEEAEQLAAAVNYKPTLDGNTLTCHTTIDLTGQKFRAQHVNLILYVPEGKYVALGPYANNFASFDYDSENSCDGSDDDNDTEVWQMQGDGTMVCPEGKKQNKAEKILTNNNFKSLKVRGNIVVEVVKGDRFEVKLRGKERYLSKVDVIQSDDVLNIRADIDDERKMTLLVTMPSLELFDADDIEELTIKGFKQKTMKINLYGDFKADLIVDVEEMEMDAERTHIDLQGKGNKLNVRLDHDSELKARQFTVATATVDLDGGSDAEIYATDSVEQNRTNGQLDVTGGAEVKEKRKKEDN